MYEYSIVATTYNDENEIISFLSNIEEQTLQPKEIVIADGGSKDNTIAIIREYSKMSKVPIIVVSKGRLNIAEGYNEAIRATSTDLVGITGVGNEYERDYFFRLVSGYKRENCRIVYSPIRGLITNSFSEKYCNTFLGGENGQKLDIASNHGALVEKSVFEEADFFYTGFVYAGEDAEFYKRTKSMGVSQFIVNEAVVRWKVPISINEYVKQVKNYTIANMQIMSNCHLIKYIIGSLLPALLMFIILVIGLFNHCIIIALIIMLLIFLFSYFILKIKRKSVILKIVSVYLPVYYILTKHKFCKKEYKVSR